jgi:hypothetical protein
MLPRLLFALGFALSAVIATTGAAAAAFDPDRDELIGITAAVIGIVMAFLTLVFAIKWYFGWDVQDPDNQDLQDYLSSHHVVPPLALMEAEGNAGHGPGVASGHAAGSH